MINYKSDVKEILTWFYNRAPYLGGKASNIEMSLSNPETKLMVAMYTSVFAKSKDKWILNYKGLGIDSSLTKEVWTELWERNPNMAQRQKMWVSRMKEFDEIPSSYAVDTNMQPHEIVLDIYQKHGVIVHSSVAAKANQTGKSETSKHMTVIREVFKKLSLEDKVEVGKYVNNSISSSLTQAQISRAIPQSITEYIERLMDTNTYSKADTTVDEQELVARLALSGFRINYPKIINNNGDYTYEAGEFVVPQHEPRADAITLSYTTLSGITRITKKEPSVYTIIPRSLSGDSKITLPKIRNALIENWRLNKPAILEFLNNEDNWKPYFIHLRAGKFQLDYNTLAAEMSIQLNTPINPIVLKWINETNMREKLPEQCLLANQQPASLILDKHTELKVASMRPVDV